MNGPRPIHRAAPRVVSLVPSLTETLLAWGVHPVAVTRFCEVDGYPTVGGTKNPDIDAIVALRPDVVLMDREENRLPDATALRTAGLRVLDVHVRSLDDVAKALEEVAASVGRTAPPSVGRTAPASPPPVAAGPGRLPRRIPVWVPIWRRPWMTIGSGTYGTSILAAAGFDNVYSDSDAYPTVELDDVRSRRPELVLAPSEPYPFKERHREELEEVAPVLFVDGKDLFWWGSRTAAAAERLSRLAASLQRG